MRLAAALLLCAALACAKSTEQPADAGMSGLRVSASSGIDVYQAPGSSEGSGVQGLVQVTLATASGETPVSGATVTINSVKLAESFVAGRYDTDDAALAQVIVPGATLRLLAVSGTDTASVSFGCPSAVDLTAPLENAQVHAGDVLSVSWTGRIAYNSSVFSPSAFLRPYDSAPNQVGAAYTDPSANLKLAETATSASLTVPADGKPGYIVELQIPGVFADQTSTGGAAVCILHRRVHLKGQ